MALSPLRMRVYGQPLLDANFNWTPAQLLAMIKEIDKICPEEGLLQDSVNNQIHDATREHVHE
jgi:hypothetical protein